VRWRENLVIVLFLLMIVLAIAVSYCFL
jgi:hypothetical protein